VSHAWFRNIDRRIFASRLRPGVLGGIFGPRVLTHGPTSLIRPFVWGGWFITFWVALTRVILIAPRSRFKR
jgi:hypothetical protein